MNIEGEVMWLDDHREVTLTELIDVSGLSEAELLELVHGGAIPVRNAPGDAYLFSARVVTLARTACRLRNELELDMTGVVVALQLLERVRALEEEIIRLQARGAGR